MGYWAGFCLRTILSVEIKVLGRENIINDEKFFIAASHQSMFETFYLQTIFNSPVFILKKELLLIPIFGWYLKKIGSISIKRNKVTKDNLGFFDDISKMMATSNRPLIILYKPNSININVIPDDIEKKYYKSVFLFSILYMLLVNVFISIDIIFMK